MENYGSMYIKKRILPPYWGDGIVSDSASVVSATVGTGLSTASGLAIAAGSVAAIPVGGWIAAGVLAGMAGITATVAAIKKGKIRKQQAVAYAKKLGIPEPEKFPSFVVKALKLSSTKRKSLLARIKKKVDRKKDRRGLIPKVHAKSVAKLKWKYKILKAVDDVESGKVDKNIQSSINRSPTVENEVQNIPDQSSPESISSIEKEIEADDKNESSDNILYILGSAAIVGVVLLAYSNSGGKKQDKQGGKDATK